MISKLIKGTIITTLTMGLFTFQVYTAEATSKVMWGKTELKVGQIGKITILDDGNLITLNEDGSPSGLGKHNKGEEFRVYRMKTFNGLEFYGVGGGLFIPKWDTVKYETPSKSKLEKLMKNNAEYDNAITKGKLTKDPKTNADILGKHFGYTKVGFSEYTNPEDSFGSAILYDNDGDATVMTTTGEGLEGRIQINYWTKESSKVVKDTLIFFLGDKDGKLIYDKLEQTVKGKIDKNYIDKRLMIGKRIVEIDDRPKSSVIYIGKENSKYADNWREIK